MLSNKLYVGIWVLLIGLNVCEGRDRGQRYNPNTDFLLHETIGATTPPNKDTFASQFPPLGPSSGKLPNSPPGNENSQQSWPPLTPNSPKTSQNTQQSSGKRDYVAPKLPAVNPSTSSGGHNNKHDVSQLPNISPATNQNNKRDYVAPQRPTASPTSKPDGSSITHGAGAPSHQSNNGRRDYVNPQFSTSNPTSNSHATQPGKVKDLVNFYDGKDKNPQNQFSYSSVLRGNGGQNQAHNSNTPSQKTSPAPSTKPMSFSAVVGGSNKQGSQSIASPMTNGYTTLSTPKPLNGGPNPFMTSINNHRNTPTQRPLPSSFINNNKKNQINGNPPTDVEIQDLAEELLRKDTNNAAKFITINYQEKTNSQTKEDKAPLPLLVIPDNVWNIPTIQKFTPLLDNYERDTLVNEYITPQERNEENAFMDAIMSTSVIRHLMNFLKIKGFVTPDPKQQRDFLKQLWFSLYSRGKGKISSSGFEHVFVSELKNGEVSGLHNWLYFAKEEAANRANYLGYLKYTELSDKGVVMKLHFNQQGVDKPVDSMFIGTSPELEIALYTLCFVTRADKDCKLKLGGKDVDMVTHTFRYRSKNLIGSAYPQI